MMLMENDPLIIDLLQTDGEANSEIAGAVCPGTVDDPMAKGHEFEIRQCSVEGYP